MNRAIDRVPTPLRRMGHALLPRAVRRRIVARWFRSPKPWQPEFNWTPPVWPPELVVAPPDFVGLGVGRSGTTWWWRLIRDHPRVYHHRSLNKERHYFLRTRLLVESATEKSVGEYAAWFPRPPGMLTGEWTAWYLAHAWMGHSLSVVAPEAKLLVILRDPVERYRSGMTNDANRGEGIGPGGEAFHFTAGLYGYWLRVLEQYVESERLLVLQLERCIQEPERQLARTFEFLGLEPHIPADVTQPRNVTRFPRVPFDDDRRRAITRAYEHDVADLVARYPEVDRSLWPNFR